jgi:hypothetical protein
MIAVVSHDAGGAEVVSGYLHEQGMNALYCLEGPAVNVFRRKLGEIETISLEQAIVSCDWLLCGTSWQSDLEWNAIRLARQAGKRTVVFLDHWANYRERFIRNGQEHLPDEIWVGDDVALEIAKRTFPDVPVQRVDNPYFKEIRNKLASYPTVNRTDGGLRILVVCEPISTHAEMESGDERNWGYTEHDALRYLFDHLDVFQQEIESVVIRTHPSEDFEKYQWVLDRYDDIAKQGGKLSLEEEIMQSDIVAGCESMAMIIAMLADKRVICIIPPGGRPSTLPHKNIESMQELLEKNR